MAESFFLVTYNFTRMDLQQVRRGTTTMAMAPRTGPGIYLSKQVLGHRGNQPGCEGVLAEKREREKKHPDRIELPDRFAQLGSFHALQDRAHDPAHDAALHGLF